MFSRGQRRDETPSDATIHERTLRPNHEKEILYRKSRNEIRVYVGTRIQNSVCGNPELRHYLHNLDITDRLDPRESFFRGRTNGSQLYYRTKEDEKIEYVDFTSLYPWVNKTCKYPVGHPEVITSDFKEIDQYFGIAKVRILPPRGLYHPVLPYKSNGKLKFPLCQTCAEKESPCVCLCSDEDRTMTGTWCTP